jgi:hypothetical protein
VSGRWVGRRDGSEQLLADHRYQAKSPVEHSFQDFDPVGVWLSREKREGEGMDGSGPW